ncbi:MAG: hypothetical protein K2X86_17515 [Cytophagaceae bacterium]|nr:hypothetical protein [Cytophagaceae bacterium]
MRVSIPVPCHENWDQMTPVEQGRFCQSCKCKVYDFTHKNHSDIEKIYTESNGTACGRFNEEDVVKDNFFNRMKFSLASIFSLATIKILSIGNLYSQHPQASLKHIFFSDATDNSIEITDSSFYILKGRVLDDTVPVSGVELLLYDAKNNFIAKATSSSTGEFEFKSNQFLAGKTLLIKSKRKKWKRYRTVVIYPAISKTVEVKALEKVEIQMDVKTHQRIFRKKRRVVTGRYRITDQRNESSQSAGA